MRTVIIWGCALVAAAAACAAALSWIWRLEEVRVEYRDVAEAREDGFDRKGWMPCFMPNSASAISEAHDLDSNASAGVFHFGNEDRDVLKHWLSPIDPARVMLPRIRPRAWPSDVDALMMQQQPRNGFKIMYSKCGPTADAFFFVAVNWSSQTVAYWTSREAPPLSPAR